MERGDWRGPKRFRLRLKGAQLAALLRACMGGDAYYVPQRSVVEAVRSGELGASEGGHSAQPPCSGIPILGMGTDQDLPGDLTGPKPNHGLEQVVQPNGPGLQQLVQG